MNGEIVIYSPRQLKKKFKLTDDQQVEKRVKQIRGLIFCVKCNNQAGNSAKIYDPEGPATGFSIGARQL